MKGRILAIVAGAAVVASIAVTAASGAQRLDPGVTASSIKIGGTFPLTGPASLYKTIPVAEKAYFDYINDHGGVNGRKIDFTILDDAYDPSKTVSLTQQLVEQDKVFAVFGSLGTAQNLAVWNYVNQKKVPEVLLATGDSYWGFSAKKYPWTIGFQPDYPGEAKIYGKYIVKNLPHAKIGVLYQNDSFGKNSFAGLRVGLGAKKSQIVSAQPFDLSAGNVTSQVLALKASGADTFVLFATPTPAIQGLVTAAKVGWSPAHTLPSGVAAVWAFIKPAPPQRREGGRRDLDRLPRRCDDRQRGEPPGRRAREADPRAVRTDARPEQPALVLRPLDRLDDGLRAEERRQDADPRRPDAGAQEPQPGEGEEPLPLPRREAQDGPTRQLPDRGADPREVERRRNRRVDHVRQRVRQLALGRSTVRSRGEVHVRGTVRLGGSVCLGPLPAWLSSCRL